MTQIVPPPPAPALDYALYDPRSVFLATFFGTPLAGTFVMALNYRRLGDAAKGNAWVIGGMIVTVLLLILGFALPKSSGGSSVVGIVALVALFRAARQLQGPTVAAHVASGGKLASRWKAFGIGLIGFAIVFIPIAIYMFATIKPLGTRVAFGTNDAIYYSGSATSADAHALGDTLKTDGFLQDKGATILLQKGADGTILSFVVKDGIWDDQSMIHDFRTIAQSVAPTIGGLPIKLRLLDTTTAVKKELAVQ